MGNRERSYSLGSWLGLGDKDQSRDRLAFWWVGGEVSSSLWCSRRLSQSFGLQEDLISQSSRKLTMNIQWKDWCWSWSSNTLATWCKELTHLKRLWCWERFKMGGEGDDRGWDGWMPSLTQCTWVWVNSGSWRWAERPGMLQSMGSQRLSNWTELNWCIQI